MDLMTLLAAKSMGGGSGGGVTSWNDLTDKPFGESVGYGDTLTGGLASLEELETYEGVLAGDYAKISDAIVTADDVANGVYVSVPLLGAEVEVPAEEVAAGFAQITDGVFLFLDLFIIVHEQGVGVDIEGVSFPEAGLYATFDFLCGGTLTIHGYNGFLATTVKQIEEKFIPDNIVREKDLVQPDWEQTDETAMDYIKNKPVLDVVRLDVNSIDGVNRVCDTDGNVLSSDEVYALILSKAKVYVTWPHGYSIGFSFIDFNGYGIVSAVAFNVAGTANIYTAYTAEYTP